MENVNHRNSEQTTKAVRQVTEFQKHYLAWIKKIQTTYHLSLNYNIKGIGNMF